jgi:hypothetical protein
VQIALNFLDHGNLVAPSIKRNVEWVIRAEEAFKDLHWVPVERVSLVCPIYKHKIRFLSLFTFSSIFQHIIAVAVINFSQFS